jgi:hypothetical protein
MIEAMACGTPVFALRNGSVPEVIDHGVSGYVADSVEALTTAVQGYARFDRRLVRRKAEERFSAQRMVAEHERLYQRLVNASRRGGNLRYRSSRSFSASLPLPLPSPLHLAPDRSVSQYGGPAAYPAD